MTGEDKPLRQVLIFALGIGCTGLAYTFIYPLVSNLGGFIVMMGVSGFFITFAFPRKEQNFTKQAFMLPWLSIGNFTNLPTYDFGQLLVGSFTLLFGISIVSLIHYALFMPNTEARFLQRQKAFFRSSETLLLHLRACREQRRGSLFRLGMFFRLHRTRFLAEEIGILARKLPVTFVKPELVRVFFHGGSGHGVLDAGALRPAPLRGQRPALPFPAGDGARAACGSAVKRPA